MFQLDSHPSGRHFLQIPGPTNVPDRVLRAIDQPDDRPSRPGVRAADAGDPRRPEATCSRPRGPVVIYPASGTGAWEAALVNTLSPGDRVLMFETGHFATLWRAMAEKLGLVVDFVPGDWRSGVDPAVVEAKLADDQAHAIKAVLRRAQRDLDRRHEPHCRDARRRSIAPAIRRCSWSTRSRRSRSHRLPARRMGRRRHRRRLAEGPDAAAGPVVQRRQRQGARGEQAGEAAALVLALGRDDRDEPAGLLSRTRRRPTCSTACTKRSRCCAKRACTTVFARHQRHAEATRRAVRALGARGAVPQSAPSTAAR